MDPPRAAEPAHSLLEQHGFARDWLDGRCGTQAAAEDPTHEAQFATRQLFASS